jgi:hypothetical protein
MKGWLRAQPHDPPSPPKVLICNRIPTSMVTKALTVQKDVCLRALTQDDAQLLPFVVFELVCAQNHQRHILPRIYDLDDGRSYQHRDWGLQH